MLNNGADFAGTDTVEANIGAASASFVRSGATAASLKVEYRVGGLEAQLRDGSLEEGVQALCEREITSMRGSLSQLGEDLAGQLSDKGLDPSINRSWQDSDERSWIDRRTSFSVAPTKATLQERLNGYKGVSDAKLVRGSIALMLEQRENSIRTVYGAVLADARAKRGQGNRPAEERLQDTRTKP